MKLIDGEKLIEDLRRYKHEVISVDGLEGIISLMPSAETERKTGKWIRHPEQNNIYGGKCIECSECGDKYVVSYIEDEKFCRNCGAKMEVKE